MAISIRPVVSPGLAGCCTIFSVIAVVILLALASAFSRHVEVLTGSKNDPKDPSVAAATCYAAALIYGIFVVFCGLQMAVHRRYPRGVQL
ncbi:hypothetical protein CI109_104843 [Kwoniella shandongensis]|uniref:Uncharacterized protein n=1 Tax=Kwoniella shandongensis TaxID=1734106 RepID=A0A5M6BTT3_9TREE|nr:uncharacterized protein CI109_006171 [Kwoniella shandongensis]KAA5525480.1 hypothetical protein CI109_006171 [Kwoniella shandongensis]